MKMRRKGCCGSGGLGFLPCLGITALSVPIFALFGTALACASDDPTARIGVYSLVSLLAAAAVSGFAVSRLAGEGGVKCAVLSALSVVLIMTLVALIITGEVPTLGALMNYGCYLGVAALSAILARRRSRKRRR